MFTKDELSDLRNHMVLSDESGHIYMSPEFKQKMVEAGLDPTIIRYCPGDLADLGDGDEATLEAEDAIDRILVTMDAADHEPLLPKGREAEWHGNVR